ncbi:MAG: AMP-dependent synthetase/ligase [Sphingobium sp.]
MRPIERFPNLVTMFFARVRERGDAPFLWRKEAGRWESQSWNEVAVEVAALASALRSLGLNAGDPVMLVSENRPEFCIADLAIMAAGCVTVPTYTTNTTRDHQHILTDSGARAVIVSTAKLAQVLMPAVVRSQAQFVIGMEPLRGAQGTSTCHVWSELIARHPTEVDVCAMEQTATREDLACIIYTSGTGGAPRGVMQHHGAILCNVEGAGTLVAEDFGWDDEVFLSFLPLSHAYEHSGGQYLPMILGGQIHYAEGLEKLSSNIEEVRPTIMVVVPRLFEVLRTRIIKSIEKQGKFPGWLLEQALRIAARERDGKSSVLDLPMKLLLARTLKPKIAARFGGRMKALVSGGAPLNPDVGLFFQAVGLTLLQGYGQTEAGPVISCNRPRAGIAMDTVGPPLDGVEVLIAEDGEILVRGELVMHGYWRNPAETEKALKDGWLHTGDIGEIDARGRIRITDRKKDLIVNDKGDNVSPQKVEGMLTLQPEIGQAMVHGDRRPHLVGVLVPDAEWTREWAAANGREVAGIEADPAYLAALRAAVDRVNEDLSVLERVRRFILADEPYAIENEEMTPSMKIRRHVIRRRYQDRLDALYKG